MKIYRTLLLLSVLLGLLPFQAYAGMKTFIRDYTYQASESDSKLSCRAIALEEVKKLLLAELGTHIYHEVNASTNSDGVVDASEQIRAITAGITRIEIIEENWDGSTYSIKAMMKADPDEVLESVNAMRSQKATMIKLDLIEQEKKRADIENAKLKEQIEALIRQNARDVELARERQANLENRRQQATRQQAAVLQQEIESLRQKNNDLSEQNRIKEQALKDRFANSLVLSRARGFYEKGEFFLYLGNHKAGLSNLAQAIELDYAPAKTRIYRFYWNEWGEWGMGSKNYLLYENLGDASFFNAAIPRTAEAIRAAYGPDDGRDVNKLKQALQRQTKLARDGNKDAQDVLGLIVAKVLLREAMAVLPSLAKAGDKDAQYELSKVRGDSDLKEENFYNKERSDYWIDEAILNGNIHAANDYLGTVGYTLSEWIRVSTEGAVHELDGVYLKMDSAKLKREYATAKKSFFDIAEPLAELKDQVACVYLADFFHFGMVEEDLNFKRAETYYQCAGSDPSAVVGKADLYRWGGHGLEPDFDKLYQLLDPGHAEDVQAYIQCGLLVMHENNSGNPSRDKRLIQNLRSGFKALGGTENAIKEDSCWDLVSERFS